MHAATLVDELARLGLDDKTASSIASILDRSDSPQAAWQALCQSILTPAQPFEIHQRLHDEVFASWNETDNGPAPVWLPDDATLKKANLTHLMSGQGLLGTYQDLHAWSAQNRFDFWKRMLEVLSIPFIRQPASIVADRAEVETPDWLPGAALNIADSCFVGGGDDIAIIRGKQDCTIERITLSELGSLANRVANGLAAIGMKPGDAVAIDMPMIAESIGIYLGIVRAGCAVVSIADSFAAREIATRLRIADTRLVFTQDVIRRGGKTIPLYERVTEAQAPQVVVLPAGDALSVTLRDADLSWADFLSENEKFESVACTPGDASNILFSSGTTGDPKAIPWTHTTPIKSAADAWLHHDIHSGDVLAWPTNLGWMMGPWLIYAALVNRATVAIHEGAPTTPEFCQFVERAGVTMLGVVPSLVKAWRAGDCTAGCDWSAIRAFSSTGECSNRDDMFWLMSRAGYKPVIEYCGGTEIGGGYITGTMVQPAAPAAFSTPAMGLDVVILDEDGRSAESGELLIVPPSIGLSNTLLNRDHHEVYFEGTPTGPNGEALRRHGDEMRRLPGGFYQALGRADDTMNLGGIKTSSAEIERVLNQLPGVRETAAVAVPPPGGGPDRLIIFVVGESGQELDGDRLRPLAQQAIREQLNPLFRVAEVSLIDALPRTASNKVMRRKLRGLAAASPPQPS